METSEALQIIKILADGVDPTTGEVFDDNSPCQHPQVIRALFVAIGSMERVQAQELRRRELPSNAGKPWSDEEDTQLIDRFKQGLSVRDLSRKHQRTRGSIESRLVKHGLIATNTT